MHYPLIIHYNALYKKALSKMKKKKCFFFYRNILKITDKSTKVLKIQIQNINKYYSL